MNLMRTLAERGVLVSYGRMSRQPMTVQPGNLIFKKQTLRGFWLLDWYRSAQPDSITAMFDHLAPLIASGKISTPVSATYNFDQFREAIGKAAESLGRSCSRRIGDLELATHFARSSSCRSAGDVCQMSIQHEKQRLELPHRR